MTQTTPKRTQTRPNIEPKSIRKQSKHRFRANARPTIQRLLSWKLTLIRGTRFWDALGPDKLPKGRIGGPMLGPKSIKIDAKINDEQILKNYANN